MYIRSKGEREMFEYGKLSPNEMYKQYGIYSFHFYPFEDQNLNKYGEIGGMSEEEYVENLQQYLISTVYKGI